MPRAQLNWTASTDNVAVTGYNIYRNTVKVATSPTNSYLDTGLAAATSYTYNVSAYDAAGNESGQSSSVVVTTPGGGGGGGTLPSGVALVAIDGETMTSSTTMSNNYYTRSGFTNAANLGWDSKGFIPVGTFNSRLKTSLVPNIFTKWADLGFNTAFCRFNTSDWDTSAMLSAGIAAIENGGAAALSGSYGTNFVGFLTEDEPHSYAEGVSTPIAGTANSIQNNHFWWVNNTWAYPASYFPEILTGAPAPATVASVISDLITTPNTTKRHIDLVSSDVYSFAGTRDWGFMNGVGGAASRIYGVTDCTPDQSARGSFYGDVIDKTRAIQSTYPAPLLSYIETGDPFNGDTGTGAKYITAAEINWGIWQSLIHGARLIALFDISFSGPGAGSDCLSSDPGGWYSTIQSGQTMSAYTAVKSALALMRSLNAVLGSPSATGYCTVSPAAYVYPTSFLTFNNGIDINVKWTGSQFYILAATRASLGASSISATFTINAAAGATLATVVGESRTIPIVSNQFTDTFAKPWTVHIYQVS